MMPQGNLPFQIERTDEAITPHAGLTLVSETYRALGVRGAVAANLPSAGSNRGYAVEEHVETLLLLFCGGGSRLEDVRRLREDAALSEALGMRFPSADALGDWLRRTGEAQGERKFHAAQKVLIEKVLRRDPRAEFTLDVDATGIEAEKREARMTYAGYRGYMPLLTYLAENGLCVHHEFREGNVSPAQGILEALRASQERMPKGKRLARFRSDSAGYQAAVFNACEEDGVTFAVAAAQDSAVREAIAAIPEEAWKPMRTKDGLATDKEVAETVHTMNETQKAFRLVVQRWRPEQMPLYEKDAYFYHAVATNDEERSAESVVWWYNERGNSENYHKEVKLGFGMEHLPCGEFSANAVFFAVGVLAYNLMTAFKRLLLSEVWWTKTIRTLQWEIIQIAGRWVRHGRRAALKLAGIGEEFLAMWRGMRRRLADLAAAGG